jgi:hypothetical protein
MILNANKMTLLVQLKMCNCLQTLMRQVEKMSANLKKQLYSDIIRCSCFSLQCDESTDISDTAQLLVFVLMVFSFKELLGMISLKERTKGVNMFNAFRNFLNDLKVTLFKLVLITTDGAAAMIGRINRFIALCQKEDEFPSF